MSSGHSDHGDLGDGGVVEQHGLDLGRVDVLSAGDDHVGDPVGDRDEPIGVTMSDVAGSEPPVGRTPSFGGRRASANSARRRSVPLHPAAHRRLAVARHRAPDWVDDPQLGEHAPAGRTLPILGTRHRRSPGPRWPSVRSRWCHRPDLPGRPRSKNGRMTASGTIDDPELIPTSDDRSAEARTRGGRPPRRASPARARSGWARRRLEWHPGPPPGSNRRMQHRPCRPCQQGGERLDVQSADVEGRERSHDARRSPVRS